MLVFVGLGYSMKHLTREAYEWLERASVIYVDTYTSLYEDPLELLRDINPRAEFVLAKRRDLEGESIARIVERAQREVVAIAVPGDPFIATTHDAILSEAIKRGVEFKVVHGLSILTMAYSRLGLQSYRFGKIVTLVYPEHFKPFSTLDVIYDNLSRGLHTLVLLDLKVEESRSMSIPEAVDILIDLDYRNMLQELLSIALARLGWRDEKICADQLYKLKEYRYPPPPHSLVIVGRLDPVEEEIVEYWKKRCN